MIAVPRGGDNDVSQLRKLCAGSGAAAAASIFNELPESGTGGDRPGQKLAGAIDRVDTPACGSPTSSGRFMQVL